MKDFYNTTILKYKSYYCVSMLFICVSRESILPCEYFNHLKTKIEIHFI